MSSLSLSLLAASSLVVVGCSAGDDDDSFGNSGKAGSHAGSAGTHNTGGTSAGVTNTGGMAGESGSDLVGGNAGTSSGSAGSAGTMACAGDIKKAEKIPLDIYMMIDQSGSMTTEVDPGTTKWQAVVSAMTGFFDNTPADGLSVGLQFFSVIKNNAPSSCTSTSQCNGAGSCVTAIKGCVQDSLSAGTIVTCASDAECSAFDSCEPVGLCASGSGACFPSYSETCDGISDTCEDYKVCDGRDSCDVADYANPLVGMASLDQNRTALVGEFNGRVPDTNTPTGPALQGAIQYARGWASGSGQNHKVITILVTDGFPSVCTPKEIPQVADVATEGRVPTGGGDPPPPSIETYVIGVFAPDEAADAKSNLNLIAQAGAQRDAFIISSNVTQELTDALNEIRGTALTCEYAVPTGTNANFSDVQVVFTPDGGQPTDIHYAKTAEGCDPVTGGWYYDLDPLGPTHPTPTKILTCPVTCMLLSSAGEASLSIEVGCNNIEIQ